jgi:uncharacterized SAM-binding protein YcdF (DUF218 family)
MFFPASKIVFFLIQPSTLIVLIVAAGLLLAWHGRSRLGLRLATLGVLLLVVAGLLPLGNVLVLPLEERFRPPAVGPEDGYAGLIILGGFEDGWVSAGRPGLAVNEAAERLTEGVRLARRLPAAKVVYTGGVANLLFAGAEAAGPVGDFLADAGVPRERIVLEGKSRNTHENATFTRALLEPRPGARWLLVTSAYHMPRAMGSFRAAGLEVTAYPVDYRTRGWGDALRPFEGVPAGLARTDLAAKEWIGLLAYRLTGRTGALFPGP